MLSYTRKPTSAGLLPDEAFHDQASPGPDPPASQGRLLLGLWESRIYKVLGFYKGFEGWWGSGFGGVGDPTE